MQNPLHHFTDFLLPTSATFSNAKFYRTLSQSFAHRREAHDGSEEEEEEAEEALCP